MSKTLTEIGLIIGGLALAVFAGPIGIIALQGNVAAFNAMVGIGITTALSGVGLALRQTPQAVSSANTLSFNNAPTPRRVIYGQFQTAGVLTYVSFPPSENQNVDEQRLHLVYTLAGHEITSFDGIAINGTPYNFGSDLIWNGSYWVLKPDNSSALNDFYWLSIEMNFDAGKPGNSSQAFSELGAVDSAWTTAFKQQGCAKVHVVCSYSQGWPSVFPSGNLPNFQFLVTGKRLFDPRVTTAWAATTNYPEFSYVLDNNGCLFFQQTSGSPASGSVRPNFEGSEGAGSTLSDGGCTWYSTGQFVPAIYSAPWTPAAGVATPVLVNGILVNDGWQPSVTYGQLPNQLVIEAPAGYLQLLTAGGGGSSASGSTYPASWSTTLGGTTTDGADTWTCLGRSTRALNASNSALCTLDYLLDTDAGLAVSVSTVDLSSAIAAANVCEEQEAIIWNPDNTVVYENLYSANGMFDHSSTRGDVLTSLCGSMAGWCVPPGDAWHIFAGAYVTPTLAFTDDDLRAPIKGDFRLSKRDVANSIKGRYVPSFVPSNPGALLSLTQIPGAWQAQSFPAYQANGLAGKPDYLNSEDGGQVIWQEIQLDFTTSLWTAQRLAKITLMRLRFQDVLTLPFKMTAFQLEAGDTFGYTHARWSITGGTFLAMQAAITFDDGGGGKDAAPVVGIDVIAQQTGPSIYEFQGPTSSSNYGEYSPYGVTGVMTGVE